MTCSFSGVELGKIIVLYLVIYGMQHAYTCLTFSHAYSHVNVDIMHRQFV